MAQTTNPGVDDVGFMPGHILERNRHNLYINRIAINLDYKILGATNMIRVIGWETTKEAIDQKVKESKAKESEFRANPLVRKIVSSHASMRARLNREIEDKIGRRWERSVSGEII